MDKRTFTGRRAGIYKKKTYAKRGQALMVRRAPASRPPKPLPLGGFYPEQIIKLKYAETITINPAASGAASVHVFRANSMFDPNFTGTGAQPKGFDQWMSFYNHFTVIGAKIKVTPVFGTLGSQIPCAFGVALTAGGNELSGRNIPDIITSNRGQNWTCHGNFGAINTTTQKCPTAFFSAKKFFGKDAIVNSSIYRGSATANPTEQAFFEIWACGIDSGDPPQMPYIVEVWYTAVLTERIVQPPS